MFGRLLLACWAGLALISCAPKQPAVRHPPAGKPASQPAAKAAAFQLLEYVDNKKDGKLKVVRPIPASDPRHRRFSRLLARPYLQWVLRLGAASREVGLEGCKDSPDACARRYDHPALLVLVKRGNRPKRGLAVLDGAALRRLPETFYMEVDPRGDPALIAHEYSHVVMYNCLSKAFIVSPPLHPRTLPHTTAAISNDLLAFTEGWAIHFETLAGDRRENPRVFARAGRAFAVDGDPLKGDSLLAARDLLSYAQSYRRQWCIKENCFSYLPRPRADLERLQQVTPIHVLERWTDSTHDPSRLRTLEQLVASEGAVATLFYRLATSPTPRGPAGQGGDPPLPDPALYRAFLEAFARLTPEGIRATPTVLSFAEHLLGRSSPAERTRVARVLLETTHYTPLLRDAPAAHQELHRHGRRLEPKQFKARAAALARRMADAVKRLSAKPELLRQAAGPELWLANKQMTLDMPILGVRKVPLNVDLNTAPRVMLMTIPGVDAALARAAVEARLRRPFKSLEDFAQRLKLSAPVAATLQQMRRDLLDAMKPRN